MLSWTSTCFFIFETLLKKHFLFPSFTSNEVVTGIFKNIFYYKMWEVVRVKNLLKDQKTWCHMRKIRL